MIKLRTSAVTAALLSAAGGSGIAHAAWDTVPRVTLRVEPDDNPRLVEFNPQSDVRSVFDAQLVAVNFTERGEVRFEPSVQINQYQDSRNEDLDSTDLFLASRGRYTWQRAQADFYADISRQSILAGELLDARPGDPDAPDLPGVDTGQLRFLNQDIERTLIRPSFTFEVAERTGVTVDLQAADVTYTGPTNSLRSDFSDTNFAIGLQHRPSQGNTVTARLFSADYDANVNNNNTKSTGLLAAFTRQLSETMFMGFDLGLIRSDFTFLSETGVVDNSESNHTFNLSLRKRAERTTLNFDVGRYVDPNGSGYVIDRDQIWLSASRTMRPRLIGSAGVRFTRTRTVGDVAQEFDRDYARVELDLEWALSERWFLSAGYRHTAQEFVEEDSSVSSNSIYVGIGYAGLSRR